MLFAIQIDGVGVPLEIAVVAKTVTDPVGWEAMSKAVVHFTRRAATSTVRWAIDIGAVATWEENATPDRADQVAGFAAGAAVETACAGYLAFLLSGTGKRHACKKCCCNDPEFPRLSQGPPSICTYSYVYIECIPHSGTFQWEYPDCRF